MTVTVINSNVVGADYAVYLMAGDLFIVTQNASFISWTTGYDAGVLGNIGSPGVGVTILGNYIGSDLSLFGGDRITVGSSGSIQVSEPAGIVLMADRADGITSMINEGSVHSGFVAGSDAITLTLSDRLSMDALGFQLTNTGLIEATSLALSITGTGKAQVANSGVISGGIVSSTPAVELLNTGLILGAIQLDDGADRIVNSGTIHGTIDTGGGNDVIDLRHGLILGENTVYGGTGDDTYYVDDPGLVLVESGGMDRVFAASDFTLSAGFETLTLLGGARRGMGSTDANRLNGNAQDNRLDGEAGNDSLFGYQGEDVLQGGLGADELDGGSGDDRLYGGQLLDRLFGGDGEDTLVGGAGRDTLTGGQDGDVFLFGRLTHTLTANPDQITDFTQQEDVIDLSGIDANTVNLLANDSFSYLGSGAFTSVAGQLRHEILGAVTWVRLDVNGDGVSDGSIRLTGAIALTANDFIF